MCSMSRLMFKSRRLRPASTLVKMLRHEDANGDFLGSERVGSVVVLLGTCSQGEREDPEFDAEAAAATKAFAELTVVAGLWRSEAEGEACRDKSAAVEQDVAPSHRE